MKSLSKCLAVLAIVALASFAHAADKPAKGAEQGADKPVKGEKGAKPQGVRGEAVKVDGSNLVIKAGKKADAKELTIATDEKTVVTIDGQPGKLADIKAGNKIMVLPETGTAQKVVVMTGAGPVKGGKAPNGDKPAGEKPAKGNK